MLRCNSMEMAIRQHILLVVRSGFANVLLGNIGKPALFFTQPTSGGNDDQKIQRITRIKHRKPLKAGRISGLRKRNSSLKRGKAGREFLSPMFGSRHKTMQIYRRK